MPGFQCHLNVDQLIRPSEERTKGKLRFCEAGCLGAAVWAPSVWAPVWYENLSGVVSCPENSNINTDGLDSVLIGSREQ